MKLLSRLVLASTLFLTFAGAAEIGSERAIERHFEDGQEFQLSLRQLLAHGRILFRAVWTVQEGGGRPLNKGTGAPLSDLGSPLVFPRNFNRISGPDANACEGCHARPRLGGGGEIVSNVFVLGERFDFTTFDLSDGVATRGMADERGTPATQQTVGNERASPSLFGAGYIELLAREMTTALQGIRNAIQPGGSAPLMAKGVRFGTLARDASGTWDISGVEGIPAASLVTSGAHDPPSLIIRPFHQAGRVVSLREFANNAFNRHHGIQSSERFGRGLDPDGDGFIDELTRADITAVTLFLATLPVPGRVIPTDPDVEAAIRFGELQFVQIGCARCHVPALRLRSSAFVEPNRFNPAGNLQPGETRTLRVDLSSQQLPEPRLVPGQDGSVLVPAYTDLKLHDLCDGPDDPNAEAMDMQQASGSPEFFAGNCRFLTRKLWGTASEPPFFHHGRFTTLREAVLAHGGEGAASRAAFEQLAEYGRDSIIEFLKTLQVLPARSRTLVIDERGNPRAAVAVEP